MTVAEFKAFIANLKPEWDGLQISVADYDDEYMATHFLPLDELRAEEVPGWGTNGPLLVLIREAIRSKVSL